MDPFPISYSLTYYNIKILKSIRHTFSFVYGQKGGTVIPFSKLESSSQLFPLVTLACNSHTDSKHTDHGSNHAMHLKGLRLQKCGIKNNGEVLPVVFLLIKLKISSISWMPVLKECSYNVPIVAN